MKKQVKITTGFTILVLLLSYSLGEFLSTSLITNVHAQEASQQGQKQADNTLTDADRTNSDGAMYRANLHRTGVFRTKGVPTLRGRIWESPKLFTITRGKVTTEFGRDLNLSGVGMVYFPGRDWYVATDFDYSDPIIANSTIYFALYIGDGFLYALDAASGQIKWRAKRPQGVFTYPCVAGDSLYVGTSGSDGGLFYAMNVQTQAEKWRYALGSKSFVTTAPAVANGTVYFGTNDGTYFALDARTGQKKWTFETQPKGRLTSPTIAGETIYFGDQKNLLHAVNASTGQERWRLKIKDGIQSMALADATLYVNNLAGQIYAVDAQAGRLLPFSLKGVKAGTPLAIDNQTIYFGGLKGGNMYATDATTGELKWKLETKEPCQSPVIAEGIIYFSCVDGKLYAADAKTGKMRWTVGAGKSEISSPVIADGVLYFITDEGYVYAVK